MRMRIFKLSCVSHCWQMLHDRCLVSLNLSIVRLARSHVADMTTLRKQACSRR